MTINDSVGDSKEAKAGLMFTLESSGQLVVQHGGYERVLWL